MHTNIYTIRDVIGNQFGHPMLARTDLAASRTYIQMISAGKINQQEFKLYLLGSYDDETGVITPLINPTEITPLYKADAGLEEVAP